MNIQIDEKSSFWLIFLLAIITPTFCSERNQRNSTTEEHLRTDSHVTEIYLSNETLQNSSISSNENQTVQTTPESRNIGTTLQNSAHFKNSTVSTVIDPNGNSSDINKDNVTPERSNDISSTEGNVNLQTELYPNSHFNHSNVLIFNTTVRPRSRLSNLQRMPNDAEISPNSLLNLQQSNDTDQQDFNASYSKGNITGVGIKATVSVSFQLMENGNENVTENVNRTESNQNVTELNPVSRNVSLNSSNANDNSSTTQTAANVTDENITPAIAENGTAEVEIVTRNENQTEAFIVTTVVDTTVISNVTVTAVADFDSYNNNATTSDISSDEQNVTTSKTTISIEQNVTASSNLTSYTNNETANDKTVLETSTTLFPDTTEETTTERQPLTRMAGEMKIVNGMEWRPELDNRQSTHFRKTANTIRNLLEEFFSHTKLKQFLQEIKIDGFSNESLLIDYILFLKTDPVDVDSLVHQVNTHLKEGNYLLGEFTIDPRATKFEVLHEGTSKPTPAPSIEPPVPQWVIAVVVISAASFIFILLFSAVTIYERHYTRRVYNTKLQDEEEIFEKSVTLNGRSNQAAYENLAADLVYDIDKTVHSTGKQFDSWRTEAGQFVRVKTRSCYKN